MNEGFDLKRGHLYRIRSRNLTYGVYDGNGGFIGIREKFSTQYLFTEYDYDQGAPYGTVRVAEDLGPVPAGIEPAERLGQGEDWDDNMALFKFLASAEQKHGRGEGYGGRPGDRMEISVTAEARALAGIPGAWDELVPPGTPRRQYLDGLVQALAKHEPPARYPGTRDGWEHDIAAVVRRAFLSGRRSTRGQQAGGEGS